MGLIAAAGRFPVGHDEKPRDHLLDRWLRAYDPGELISGAPARKPIARAQAFLAIGGGLVGALAVVFPHPAGFNELGLLAIQSLSILLGIFIFLAPARVPRWALRFGPALATVNTTLCVYFSGDSTSAYAMFYLWVALYVFYFPTSRLESVLQILWTIANYAIAILITPSSPPAPGGHADYSNFVILVGTLTTAGILLTYLRGRMERLMGRLTDASRTDALTGLPNRVAIQEVLARELERARPEKRALSLLVIDVDRFKHYNERYGVEEGDRVIVRIGELLESTARLPDTVCRSSADEFAMVLPETDKHSAYLLAEELVIRIHESLESRGKITASIGIAGYPEHGERVGALLGAADEAMQAAKAMGRDRVVMFNAEVASSLGVAGNRRGMDSQAQLATVVGLAEALDQRDSSTARHSQTVGRLCELMAEELGFESDQIRRIRLAGVLHDIGKIGVPDSILWKPGPLTLEEQRQMRRHPELGARILSSREMDDIREWISAHHERPDGAGYPKGLKGGEIPVEASILAVADAYEAMIADRIYRLALRPEAAREELISCAGTQFDPHVVDALLRALERDDAGVGLVAAQ